MQLKDTGDRVQSFSFPQQISTDPVAPPKLRVKCGLTQCNRHPRHQEYCSRVQVTHSSSGVHNTELQMARADHGRGALLVQQPAAAIRYLPEGSTMDPYRWHESHRWEDHTLPPDRWKIDLVISVLFLLVLLLVHAGTPPSSEATTSQRQVSAVKAVWCHISLTENGAIHRYCPDWRG